MDIKTILDDGREFLMTAGGLSTQVNIISFAINGSAYDDDVVQTLTGSQIISGVVFPINSTQGSNEALLLEQGKLLTKDKMLYVGSVNISGNILIGIGSENYSIIPDGIQTYDVTGSTIYSKVFLRLTIAGSLY